MATLETADTLDNTYSWHPVIQATLFLQLVSWFSGNRINGMAIWPFVLIDNQRIAENAQVQEQYDYRIDRVIRHEVIHLRQWEECLVLLFVPLYVLSWVVRLITSGSLREAYVNNWFEREAYSNDWDKSYLDVRPWYNWIRKK